jgi:hypothetical protein
LAAATPLIRLADRLYRLSGDLDNTHHPLAFILDSVTMIDEPADW